MASRSLVTFALAALLANFASAAPAVELGAAASPAAVHSPVSLQDYLQRLRQPALAPLPAAAAATHVPRTAHDNSPYRFDMTQNGRRMTAEEFGAWMNARGIRVATGKPAATAAPASAAATAQTCQPTATTTC